MIVEMTEKVLEKDRFCVPLSCRPLSNDDGYSTPSQCHIGGLLCKGGNSPRRQKNKKYRVTFEVS